MFMNCPSKNSKEIFDEKFWFFIVWVKKKIWSSLRRTHRRFLFCFVFLFLSFFCIRYVNTFFLVFSFLFHCIMMIYNPISGVEVFQFIIHCNEDGKEKENCEKSMFVTFLHFEHKKTTTIEWEREFSLAHSLFFWNRCSSSVLVEKHRQML